MRYVATLIAALAISSPDSAPKSTGGWELVVLGIAQDGGMPHPGCTRPPCADVHAGTRPAEKVSCLGLVNRDTGAAYLIDATPDFPDQLQALTGGRPPDGIFLTHAHIGHYTGLMYLGKEAMAAKGVPVYGTERMAAFLRSNGPWSLLPHLLMTETRALLEGTRAKLWFIHLNHSNPALVHGEDVAREGMTFPL